MFHTITIRPRFCETDAAGHINNTAIMPWLEDGRISLRRAAQTDLLTVMVRLEVDYLNQIFFGSNVTVRTAVEKIGNKSIVYRQEIWQGNQRCVTAISTAVGFDADARRSIVIGESDRKRLDQFCSESAAG